MDDWVGDLTDTLKEMSGLIKDALRIVFKEEERPINTCAGCTVYKLVIKRRLFESSFYPSKELNKAVSILNYKIRNTLNKTNMR